MRDIAQLQHQEAQDGRLSVPNANLLSRRKTEFRRYPLYPANTLATRLGNILKAGERHGVDHYGLDTIRFWDQLIVTGDEATARTVSDRRADLDFFAGTAVLPVGLVLAAGHAAHTTEHVTGGAVVAAVLGTTIASVISYEAAVQVAESYASALRALVDLGRKPLAEALAITLPEDLASERELWNAMTGTSLFGPRTARTNGWLAVIDTHRTDTPGTLGQDLAVLSRLRDYGALSAEEYGRARQTVIEDVAG